MMLPLLLLTWAAVQQPLQTRAGDATITLGGEVMARAELRDDADLSSPGGQSDDPIRARGALGLEVDYGPYLDAFAEVLGSWGDTGEHTTSDLQQLWLQADELLGDWRLRVGRTELEISDGRLVSASRGWLFEPNAFDGAVLDGDSAAHEVSWQVWWTTGANGPAGLLDDTFAGAFVGWDVGRDLGAEAYALLRDHDAPDERQATYALRFFGTTVHGLDWSVFGAHQDGTRPGGVGIWAQALSLALGKSLDGGHRVGLEFHLATGDGLGASEHNRFDPGYADQHAMNGRADLFAFSNLVDLALLYGMAWNERWTFHADWHSFWRQNTRDDAYTAYAFVPYGISGDDRALGHELDLYAEGALADGVGLDFGGAVFLSGSAIPADEDQLWIFARFAFAF